MKALRLFTFFAIVSVLPACSVKKNTVFSRNYHGITTHYNFYFNARERMRSAAATLYTNQEDKYDRVLPVFKYGDLNQAKSVFPDLDEAIKKASIAISRHSITVKGRKDPTVAERNAWIDDCYLLIGKCQFYKHDYWTSIETFQFISAEYKNSPIRPEALLWLSKSYLELGKTIDAEYLLDYLKNDKKFPDKLRGEYNAVKAQYHLQKSDIPRAIEALKAASATAVHKDERARYTFILGQLYQKTDSLPLAFRAYERLLKQNPPYEMAFHARINRARSYDVSTGNVQLVKRELNKMLKDEKNKEFLDQIYYALAGVDRQENNEDGAISFLKQSVGATTSNLTQKALSYLELADIYLKRPEYMPAAMYYDSALTNLPQDHPDYTELQDTRNSLDRLVRNLKIISLEDSLQRLASLDITQRKLLIDSVISSENAEKERKKLENEVKQKLEQQQVLQEKELKSQPRNIAAPGTATQGAWYFYNQSAISFGVNEFLKKWGTRKLEDNWRRSEKETITENAESEASSTDSLADQQDALSDSIGKLDAASRKDAYLAMIPQTAEQVQLSNTRITEAYYNVGVIYREQLNNLKESNRTFETLDKRYPDSKYKLPSYYNLYRSYSTLKDSVKAGYYKNWLLTNYPESDYSKLILNPDFYKELQRKTEVLEVYYQNTYQSYLRGQYDKVIDRKSEAEQMYPKNKLLPKFAFLKAMAVGKTKPVNEFQLALEDVVRTYPNDTVSTRAQQMLDYMKGHEVGSLPRDTGQDAARADAALQKMIDSSVTFTFVPGNQQMFLVVFTGKSVITQDLMNKLKAFNTDNYTGSNLTVSNGNIDLSYQYILVASFPDKKEAMNYYGLAMSEPGMLSEYDPALVQFYVISQDNLTQLARSKNFRAYASFFQKNYLQ